MSDGVAISWKEPVESDITVFNYVVEYKIGGGDWLKSEYIRAPETTYLFKDTVGGQKHSFRVYSYGILAFSVPTSEVSVDIPKGKQETKSESHLVIVWQMLDGLKLLSQ